MLHQRHAVRCGLALQQRCIDEVAAAPTDALKADYLTALRGGASLAELSVMGEQIWGAAPAAPPAPREGQSWSDGFAAKLAADYHMAPAVEDRMAHEGTGRSEAFDSTFKAANVAAVQREAAGPARSLGAIEARLAEIDAAATPGFRTERVRQAHEAERGRLLEQRYAVIEGKIPPAGRPVDRGSLAAAVDPGPTSATPLVADAFGRRPDDPATATLTMPPDVPASATADQTVINGFIASVEELGVSPGWAQKLFDYDGLTLDEEPDPDAPPDAGELAMAREVVELLPPTVQKHIRTRRHLERREFVSTIAKAGAPILRRSSAERNDIRLRIIRRVSTKGAQPR